MFLSKANINLGYVLGSNQKIYKLNETLRDKNALPSLLKFYSVSPFLLTNFGDWLIFQIIIFVICFVLSLLRKYLNKFSIFSFVNKILI